ncbi:ABC transporter substrate-binding protein [Bradyrhizobium sp. AUGA SZCCT0431]|uniref:ABC transporter substrate-binding protein n=1 Tax=Bradyrhizobium sp. AUGA SZCCT0431 TaxID=2807674 RepID=UPI001BA9D40E|nr:ABC transporter substrate-binding protein [Bradyrhizobium sp. AUGA SZCCT0431]MBR1147153.1 ABC transporter substrate-binding protein [Bradyrhizobium sp. AUGA SZCCT0431]
MLQKRTLMMRLKSIVVTTLLSTLLPATAALADTSHVKIGSGFGIHYLPFYVMEKEQLLEKKAAATGLSLNVTFARFSGGASLNDAILSRAVDIVGAGVGPFSILWDKTRENLKIKAIAAMGDIPLVVLTNDPRIQSLSDIREGDRIALPAVKASMQATLLQFAAAKLYGDANFNKFDPFTATMAHSEALTALISRSGLINMHFSVAPYSTRELKEKGIRQIADTRSIIGGPMSLNLTFMSQKFHDDNPVICRAFLAALSEAMELIQHDPARAAEIYLASDKAAGADQATVETVLKDLKPAFTVVPHGVGVFTSFLYRAGIVKHDPSKWNDLFFDEANALQGN